MRVIRIVLHHRQNKANHGGNCPRRRSDRREAWSGSILRSFLFLQGPSVCFSRLAQRLSADDTRFIGSICNGGRPACSALMVAGPSRFFPAMRTAGRVFLAAPGPLQVTDLCCSATPPVVIVVAISTGRLARVRVHVSRKAI